MAPPNLFPSDNEIDELLKQQALAPPVSEQITDPVWIPLPSPITDYMIFEATNNLIYEDIYFPFNDDLGDYFDMLYISSGPSPQRIPNIVPPPNGTPPTSFPVCAACCTMSSTQPTSLVMHLLSAYTPHLGSTLLHHRECSPTLSCPPQIFDVPLMEASLKLELATQIRPPPSSPTSNLPQKFYEVPLMRASLNVEPYQVDTQWTPQSCTLMGTHSKSIHNNTH